jgi:hypothetical protein
MKIQVNTLKDVAKYPVLLDPYDNEAFDKIFKRLGDKYTTFLRVFSKVQTWGDRDPFAKTNYLRQLLKQRSNPNLNPE